MPQILPKVTEFDVVLFHKDLRLSSDWITLQIPLKGRANKSNTFRIDLTKADDRDWFRRLPQTRRIQDLLGLYGHVILFPSKNEVVHVEDKSVQQQTLAQILFADAKPESDTLLGKWDNVVRGMRRQRISL
jgi:hypothetical protein